MKATTYGTDGSKEGEIELPEVFNEFVREDLIRRAFLSEQSETFQPKGSDPWAGIDTSARYEGRKEAYHSLKNRGGAKLPREMFPKGGVGRVRKIPSSVKGRRAHPPMVEKVLIERINQKEKEKALMSAIAATANAELVKARGHKFKDKVPIIISDSVEALKKTKDVAKLFSMIIGDDLKRSVNGKKKRKGRVGGNKVPKSALVIASDNAAILKSARNIPGINVTSVNKLTITDLAPGGVAGRLTIWTKKAIEQLKQGKQGKETKEKKEMKK
jgi:large subunit ribosomal protein L4e